MKFIQTPLGTYISIDNILWIDEPFEYCRIEEGKMDLAGLDTLPQSAPYLPTLYSAFSDPKTVEVSTWKVKIAFKEVIKQCSSVILEFPDLTIAKKFVRDIVES